MTPRDAVEAALIHAAAFPPAEVWGADAIGLMLDLPGTFGIIRPGLGFIMARVAADEAEVLTLAVRPEARRQGVGAGLLATALAGAVARGAGSMFLEVSERNPAARVLYGSAGFSEVGRRRRYYPDGADALVLRRSLST